MFIIEYIYVYKCGCRTSSVSSHQLIICRLNVRKGNLFKSELSQGPAGYCPTSDIDGNDVCRRLPAARGASSGVRESDKCIQVPETQTVRLGALATLKSIHVTPNVSRCFLNGQTSYGKRCYVDLVISHSTGQYYRMIMCNETWTQWTMGSCSHFTVERGCIEKFLFTIEALNRSRPFQKNILSCSASPAITAPITSLLKENLRTSKIIFI